jgi:Fe-S cluster assembly protein SufD
MTLAALNPTAMEAALDAAAKARGEPPFSLPHRRIEAWRWSDLRAALREMPPAARGAATSDCVFSSKGVSEIRIADGVVSFEGDIPGARVARTNRLVGGSHALARLADLIAVETLDIDIDAPLTRPVLIRRICGAGGAHARVNIRVAPGASALVIETVESAAKAFNNGAVSYDVGAGAALERIVMQDGAEDAIATSIATVSLANKAKFRQRALILGGALARIETRIQAGADADIDMAAAMLVGGARHADATSHIDFTGAGVHARQLHRAVIADRGRAVFQGKFHVARAAQKTDAAMNAAALLLSEGGEWNAKPELEIYADDVSCAHGASAGALDRDALFYLRQRGLSENAARALLVEAFVGAMFDGISNAAIGEALRQRAHRWGAP